MPIHPSEWPLFGAKWEKQFYFAVRLTFGCRSSPHIFNFLSEALCWILLNKVHLPFVLHLLDDFLVIDFPSPNPSPALSKLVTMFQSLGVPLSAHYSGGALRCVSDSRRVLVYSQFYVLLCLTVVFSVHTSKTNFHCFLLQRTIKIFLISDFWFWTMLILCGISVASGNKILSVDGLTLFTGPFTCTNKKNFGHN